MNEINEALQCLDDEIDARDYGTRVGSFDFNKPVFGDALELAKQLPDESIDCIITSPPYWGLRDYQTENQLGLEKTPEEYISKLVMLFDELRRALRKGGTLWLNLGDSYASDVKGTGGGWANDPDNYAHKAQKFGAIKLDHGVKEKDLVGIPWRVALALRDDGWWLRGDIIWDKTASMPESVKDRPSKAHEYLFLFTKSRKYYYDKKAAHPANRRSVWHVPVATHKAAGIHFAVFPMKLIRPCIIQGCPTGGIVLDPFLGSGTVGEVCQELSRRWIGFEINEEKNAKVIESRTKQSGFDFSTIGNVKLDEEEDVQEIIPENIPDEEEDDGLEF